MTWALFWGCRLPAQLPGYGAATRAVLTHLGVETRDDLPFECCGYPSRDLDPEGAVRLAARNLARAEAVGARILTVCKCCYGQLRHAAHALDRDLALRARVVAALDREGLSFRGGVRVEHLLGLLDRELGAEAIAARVTKPQSGRRVAAAYGCHALRPSNVAGLDNPLAPEIFERLVAATGATPVDWSRRLDCCGRPLQDRNPAIGRRLAQARWDDAAEAGADTLCSACTWCQLQMLELRPPEGAPAPEMTAITYAELLARALGH